MSAAPGSGALWCSRLRVRRVGCCGSQVLHLGLPPGLGAARPCPGLLPGLGARSRVLLPAGFPCVPIVPRTLSGPQWAHLGLPGFPLPAVRYPLGPSAVCQSSLSLGNYLPPIPLSLGPPAAHPAATACPPFGSWTSIAPGFCLSLLAP